MKETAMREYVELGCAPAMEDCAQVGDSNYSERARQECRAFIAQIRRENPDLPEGVSLRMKSNNHDFGCYYEVVASFMSDDEEAVQAAWGLESKTPTRWDEEALDELKIQRLA